MNKQRICIVGDGLSGLMTAVVLGQIPGVEINLIAKKAKKNLDNRTTAISQTNFKFIQENIFGLDSNLFWPSKNIELFYETSKERVNFLNLKEPHSNLMYVFENDKIKRILLKEIRKNKIKIVRREVKKIEDLENYDLAILCLGSRSSIYEKIIKLKPIRKDYKEVAVTGYVKHDLKNLNTSQFFLKEGPLAILPFSRNCFSFVWSLKKKFYEKKSKKIVDFIQHKLLELLKIKKKIYVNNIQSYPIALNLKRQYYKKNILILGEGLHSIHPLAGQGFNLVLRDIKKLKEVVKYYVGLGISISNSYALSDFYNNRKPENIIMGLGVDLTHKFFKKSRFLEPVKKTILKQVSKSEFLKNLSKRISDKGLY